MKFANLSAVGMIVSAFSFWAAPAAAQDSGINGTPGPVVASEAQIKEASAKPTPRDAAGHPDLTGFWGKSGPDIAHATQLAGDGKPTISADGKNVVFGIQPIHKLDVAAQTQLVEANPADAPSYKPEYLAKVNYLSVHANRLDPGIHCTPLGIPRDKAPDEIIQNAKMVVFLYNGDEDAMPEYRVIPLDGRQRDPNVDSIPEGDAIGRWDGDTLVVDTIKISDDTWLNGNGTFHDRNLHVVERFTRKGDLVTYEKTVEDPTLLTKPWVRKPFVYTLGKPGGHVNMDYPCHERSSQHFVNNDRGGVYNPNVKNE